MTKERNIQKELERIYGEKKSKKPENPTVTIKGIVQQAPISEIRKQIEKARNP